MSAVAADDQKSTTSRPLAIAEIMIDVVRYVFMDAAAGVNASALAPSFAQLVDSCADCVLSSAASPS